MPIVGPLLWLAVASLLIALFGVVKENIRLKREINSLHFKASPYILTETEKASNV